MFAIFPKNTPHNNDKRVMNRFRALIAPHPHLNGLPTWDEEYMWTFWTDYKRPNTTPIYIYVVNSMFCGSEWPDNLLDQLQGWLSYD